MIKLYVATDLIETDIFSKIKVYMAPFSLSDILLLLI